MAWIRFSTVGARSGRARVDTAWLTSLWPRDDSMFLATAWRKTLQWVAGDQHFESPPGFIGQRFGRLVLAPT